MSTQRMFTCSTCKASDQSDYEDTPHCCGGPMRAGAPVFKDDGKPAARKLHMVKLRHPEKLDEVWQLPTRPEQVYELWQLKAGGRAKSELLGYLGRRLTKWEWVPPNGIGMAPGFADSGEEAAKCLLLAMDGGAVARKMIASIAS